MKALDVIAGGLAAGAGASLWTACALPHIVLASGLGALAVVLCRPRDVDAVPAATAAVERFSGWAVLVFLVPAVTRAVAPGADMAMYVALARAIALTSDTLSPAWGDVGAVVYPRGFPAWIAMLSVVFDFAASGLLAAGGVYVLFTFALRAYLRDVVRIPYPGATAVLCVLLAKSPQSFFGWGGSSTIAAIAMGLIAAALIARLADTAPVRVGVITMLVAFGAGAVHPIGAAAGALAIAACPVITWTRARRLTRSVWRQAGSGAMTAAGLLAVFVLLRAFGPHLSESEIEWIRSWQIEQERLLVGPPWLFPATVWIAVTKALGKAYVITLAVAVIVEIGTRAGRRRCAGTVVAVTILGGIVAFGPLLPSVGALLYPVRFTPLLAVATCPLLAFAAVDLAERRASVSVWLVVVAFTVGVTRNVANYQSKRPLATRADLAVIRCLDERVPREAVIKGVYGDATQWIPALAGRAITSPHWHISLRDEIAEWRSTLEPTHRFVGERTERSGKEPSAARRRRTVCEQGGAVLYEAGSRDRTGSTD